VRQETIRGDFSGGELFDFGAMDGLEQCIARVKMAKFPL